MEEDEKRGTFASGFNDMVGKIGGTGCDLSFLKTREVCHDRREGSRAQWKRSEYVEAREEGISFGDREVHAVESTIGRV